MAIGGSPWTLHQRGYRTNHKLVMKLMEQEHLTCVLRQKKYRSYRGEVGRVAPNLLKRHFKAMQAQYEMDHGYHRIQGAWARNSICPPSWIFSTGRSLAIPSQRPQTSIW